jgi:molecular chaperone GrpE
MTQEKVMEATEASEAVIEADATGQAVAEGADSDNLTGATVTPEADAHLMEQLRADLTATQAKVDELTDKLQRTAAEFQNSRRRQERQLAEEIERASTHLLKRLLPVIDDLTLAFQNVPPTLDESQRAWGDGFRQIQKKLTTLLEDEGVKAVALDGPFDPARHEAVTSEPHETVPGGHIIDTLRAGYEYKGRVLRPALVRVAL